MDPSTAPGEDSGSGAELSSTAVWTAGFCAISATMISLVAIWMQLKNYRKPLLQRFVVRILWMVPIFALSSWVSLVSLNAAFYIDAFRDIYEAFVIYCFFSLLVCYLGGERSLLVMLHGRPYTKHLWPVSMWSKEMDVGDPYTFLFIKRGILQYVYVKPILAAVTMLLKSNGAYNDGSVSLTSGYFWVSFVYNLSVCLSLYCLGMFFMATQDDLEEFRPIPKFLCIKAVIFFSFWQGFAISVLVATGIMQNTSAETAVAIQDFLICFEMVFASVGHWYAFSHKDYTELDIHSARMPIYYAVRDASGIKDIIQDSLETLRGTRFTYRTFEPSEGVATVGMSRSGRIMAGLRYTGGGTAKYWLPDANKIGREGLSDSTQSLLPSSSNGIPASSSLGSGRPDYARNPNSYSQQMSSSYNERAPSLFFADVDEQDDDGMEELYDASKQLEFGDYNFPAIDVYDPKRSKESDRRKMERKNKRKARRQQYEESSLLLPGGGGDLESGQRYHGGYSVIGEEEEEDHSSRSNAPLMSESGFSGSTFGKGGWGHASSNGLTADTDASHKESMTRSGGSKKARDGCVDNVNGFVPDKKKKKGSAPPPASRQQQQQRQLQHQQQQQQQTYGYGYQSYQNQSLQPQQQKQENEQSGPMFFFF
ncbi:organic solute transporter subunit alpha [Entomortierella parvispora]|uniref:Organic solute transporter subunit alpha n=1 Tax=Entomortierella parvispora TaxID=205924 RepID=A0A9P3LZH6_9FUNG|nr:organic solute transporter subunit alpha [Entomortierella parvispora]